MAKKTPQKAKRVIKIRNKRDITRGRIDAWIAIHAALLNTDPSNDFLNERIENLAHHYERRGQTESRRILARYLKVRNINKRKRMMARHAPLLQLKIDWAESLQ